MIKKTLSLKTFSGGRDAHSTAFLMADDMEPLYSGDAITTAAAFLIASRKDLAGSGSPIASVSPL